MTLPPVRRWKLARPCMPARRVFRGYQTIGMAVAVLVLAAGCRPAPATRSLRFPLDPPPGTTFLSSPRVAPDGQTLAFVAVDSTAIPRIFIQALNAFDAVPLSGTEGVTGLPFWSPDSRSLAFFREGRLETIRESGGASTVLGPAPDGRDGTWGIRGALLFAGSDGLLWSVPETGGDPGPASRPDPERGELAHDWPCFLPDGARFLFNAYGAGGVFRGLKLGRLGSLASEPLPGGGSRAEVAAGELLYVRDHVLWAQPFDAGVPRFTGDPVPIVRGVDAGNAPGGADFSASRDVLGYRSGGRILIAVNGWKKLQDREELP